MSCGCMVGDAPGLCNPLFYQRRRDAGPMDNILPSDAAYPEFVTERVSAELKRRHLAMGRSIRSLAIPRQLTVHPSHSCLFVSIRVLES